MKDQTGDQIYTPDDLEGLVELARQFLGVVETRILCLEDELAQDGVAWDEYAVEDIQEQIQHWEATKTIINKTLKKFGG